MLTNLLLTNFLLTDLLLTKFLLPNLFGPKNFFLFGLSFLLCFYFLVDINNVAFRDRFFRRLYKSFSVMTKHGQKGRRSDIKNAVNHSNEMVEEVRVEPVPKLVNEANMLELTILLH